MRVVRVKPGMYPEVVDIDSSLESLQNEVDGFIQVIYPFNDNVGLVCDEEGKFSGKDMNRAIFNQSDDIDDIIVGTFLIVGLGEEDFTDLEPELCYKYQMEFWEPQVFARIGNKLYVFTEENAIGVLEL